MRKDVPVEEQELAHDATVILNNHDVEGRHAVIVASIHVSTQQEQRLHVRRTMAHSRIVKGGPVVGAGSSVNVSAVGKQSFDDIRLAFQNCQE